MSGHKNISFLIVSLFIVLAAEAAASTPNTITRTTTVISPTSHPFIGYNLQNCSFSLLKKLKSLSDGGPCDLYFDSVTYNPNPPKKGKDISFHIIIKDRCSNMTSSLVYLQTKCNDPDWPLNFLQVVEMTNSTAVADYSFTWIGENGKTYSLMFVVSPDPDQIPPWIEQNETDNTFIAPITGTDNQFIPSTLMMPWTHIRSQSNTQIK